MITITIVRAKRDGNLATFKCKWCGKTHIHGWGSGFRASHCQVFTKDYFLWCVEEAEDDKG